MGPRVNLWLRSVILAVFLIVLRPGMGQADDETATPLPVLRVQGKPARLYVAVPEPKDILEVDWRFGVTKPIKKILQLNCGKRLKKDYEKNMEDRLRFHEDDSSLEILHLQPQDQGLYEALVILQDKRQIHQEFNLQVHEQFPHPVIGWEGKSACLSVGIPDQVIEDIHWNFKKSPTEQELKIASQVSGIIKTDYVEGLSSQLKLNTPDCNMQINSLQLKNSGVYRAESFLRNQGSENIQFQLTVYESSTVPVTRREGESVQLRLVIPDGTFDEIEWKFGQCTPEVTIAELAKNHSVNYNKEKYESRLDLNTVDGALQIDQLQLEDSGAYEAIVKHNGTIKIRQMFHLTVRESLFHLNGTEGESICLPLGIPQGTIKEIEWRFGSTRPNQKIAAFVMGHPETNYTEQFLSRLEMDPENSSLKIKGLQLEDSGFYESTVVLNNGKQIRKVFHLIVSGSSLSVIKIEGQSVRLSLGNLKGRFAEIDWRYGNTAPNKKLARVLPGGIVMYYQDGNKKRLELNTTDGSLQIDDLKLQDSGFYDTIVLISETALVHKMFHLIVQGKVGDDDIESHTAVIKGLSVGMVIVCGTAILVIGILGYRIWKLKNKDHRDKGSTEMKTMLKQQNSVDKAEE